MAIQTAKKREINATQRGAAASGCNGTALTNVSVRGPAPGLM
jgi:hypothetical protein